MSLPEASGTGTALVTGASSGIGAAIARELASRGHSLILVARREERLKSLAAELAAARSISAQTIPCDLADAADRERLLAKVSGTGRAIDVLVNSAGFGGTGNLATADTARLLEMVRVNVEAVVALTGRFSGLMAARGRGTVINIASTAAFQPMPGTAVYAAGKAFVLSFSEAIASELAGSGVSVTAVCPGPVRTEFTEAAGYAGVEDRTPGLIWMTPEQVARDAVEGAARGKRLVVPGTLNRAGAIAGRHAPRALALPVMKRIWSQV